MSDLNINQNNTLDPTLYPQDLTSGTVNAPTIMPIQQEEDVVEDATASGIGIAPKIPLHQVPVLTNDPTSLTAQTSEHTIKDGSGKPVNYPTPTRFNDMVGAATQLAASGDVSYSSFLKVMEDAIHTLQQALNQSEAQTNKTAKQFHRVAISDGDADKQEQELEEARIKAQTQAEEEFKKQSESNQKAMTLIKELTSEPNVGGQAATIQDALNKLLGDANLDPKIADMITVLGQLEYLEKNSQTNASGGIIVGNNPEIIIKLQSLGIKLPTPNPDVPFAGMSTELANKNTPPYNNPEYKNLANTMAKGWEVMQPNDIQLIMQTIAMNIRTTAGNAYGLLAKPLQGLFGSQLFSVNIDKGKLDDLRELIHLKQLLVEYRSIASGDSYNSNTYKQIEQFEKDHAQEFKDAYNKGLISGEMMLHAPSDNGIWGGGMDAIQLQIAMMDYDNRINDRGGVDAAKDRDPPPDPGGIGRLASGALIGGMTQSVSDMLSSLFATEMDNSVGATALSAQDKQNIQDIASITLVTCVIGDAIHTPAVLNGADARTNLLNSIQSMKDSGTAQNLLDGVMNNSNDSTTLSGYEEGIMQQALQAFMINVGIIAATSTNSGVDSSKAYSVLNSLQSNSEVSNEVTSAKAFWDAKSDTLSDANKFDALAQQLAQNSDGQVSSQEALREMIKMLKKILENLLSGGQSSQQFGQIVSKVKEGMGQLNAAGFSDIHG